MSCADRHLPKPQLTSIDMIGDTYHSVKCPSRSYSQLCYLKALAPTSSDS